MPQRDVKVLIVEDDREVAGHMRNLLGRHGYIAVSAYDMAEGLEKFEREKPDICVVDVYLTITLNESGIDFLEAAYKTGHNFKSLVISGRCDEALKAAILKLPIDFFLEKPIEPAQFVSAVDDLAVSL